MGTKSERGCGMKGKEEKADRNEKGQRKDGRREERGKRGSTCPSSSPLILGRKYGMGVRPEPGLGGRACGKRGELHSDPSSGEYVGRTLLTSLCILLMLQLRSSERSQGRN